MINVLHLGAGQKFDPRFSNLTPDHCQYTTNDYRQLPGISWAADLNQIPWPFPDNKFDIIIAIDILEHLEKPIAILEEIWRIMKVEGTLELQVPHFGSLAHSSDMTHRHGFTPLSFGFFIPEHPYCKAQPWHTHARFRPTSFALDDKPMTTLSIPDDWRDAMLRHKVVGNMQLKLLKC